MPDAFIEEEVIAEASREEKDVESFDLRDEADKVDDKKPEVVEEPDDQIAAKAKAAADELDKLEGAEEKPVVKAVKEDVSAAAEVVKDYVPTYKYKANGQELEIDEKYRDLIKDESSEALVRDLMERSYGLEHNKEKSQMLQQEMQKINQEYQALSDGVNELGYYLKKGDLDSAFKLLDLNDTTVMGYVKKKLEERELPPEQREALRQQSAHVQENFHLSRELDTLRRRQEEMEVSQMRNEFHSVMSSPEVQAIASEFDSRVGKANAFADEVIRTGNYYEKVEQRDLPVRQVVDEVIGRLGLSGTTAQGQAVSSAVQQVRKPAEKPVIPAVKGQGGSPVRKSVQSLDDIRKIYASMVGD